MGIIFSSVENYNEMGSGSVVLFIETLGLNVTKFKNKFVLRDGRYGLEKYNVDLKYCQGVQRFRFDIGLEWLNYAVLVSGHKLRTNDVTKTHLDELAVNRRGEGAGFRTVDSICLKRQYPVPLKWIDIFSDG